MAGFYGIVAICEEVESFLVTLNIEVLGSRCGNLMHKHGDTYASPKHVIDYHIHLRNTMEYLHTIVNWYHKRSYVGVVGWDLSGPAPPRLPAKIFLVMARSCDRHRMPYMNTAR